MAEFTGWLLDLFEDPQGGIILWFIGADAARIRLRQPFTVTFYASGAPALLKKVEAFLHSQPTALHYSYTHRQDLYRHDAIPVLAVSAQPCALSSLVHRVASRFPNLDLYDADVPLAIRYAVRHDTFPLARCRVTYAGEQLQSLSVLDSPWDLDPPPIPLRTLSMEADADPRCQAPRELLVRLEEKEHHIPLRYTRSSLIRLNTILQQYDPDLILTSNGDVWLLPYLLELAEKNRIKLQLNREPNTAIR